MSTATTLVAANKKSGGSSPTASSSSSRASISRHHHRQYQQQHHNSVRINILQGLLSHPTQAIQIVQDAFAQDAAVLKLQRWFRKQHYNRRALLTTSARPKKRTRRNSTRSKTTTQEKSKTPQTATSLLLSFKTPPDAHEHWLWKSLRSPDRFERQATVTLIQRYLQQETTTTCTKRQWANLLQRFVALYVVAQHDVSGTTTTHVNSFAGHLALEWSALLLSTTPTRHSIAWLAESLWRAASHNLDPTITCALAYLFLIHVHSNNNTTQHHNNIMNSYLWEPNQVATLWKGDDPLSPLACIVGAYYCLSSPLNTSRRTYLSNASQQAARILSQLICGNKRRLLSERDVAAIVSSSAQPPSEPSETVQVTRPRVNSLVEGYDSDFDEDNYDDDEEQAVQNSESGEHANPSDEEEHDDDEDHEDVEDEDVDEEEHENDHDDDDDDEEEVDIQSGEENGNGDVEMSDENDDDEAMSDAEEEEEEVMEDDGGGVNAGAPSLGILEQSLGLDNDGPVPVNLDEITAAVEDSSRLARQATSTNTATAKDSSQTTNKSELLTLAEAAGRQKLYVTAAMQVLGVLYPHSHHHGHQQQHPNLGPIRRPYLSLYGESHMIASVNKIIKPPRKPLNTKIIMRRAPTQEEFFRGSLSQNPVPVASLKPAPGTTGQNDDSFEPTVRDLRQHIANDLQMADSAELIEILVANKILDVRLKLRVVHDVLWRRHLIENPGSGGLSSYLSMSGGSILASRGSGISILFSSDGNRDGDDENEGSSSQRPQITFDSPASALPSIIATYRLAGVDGEATEDTVALGDLADPEEPNQTMSPEEEEARLEKEYGTTSLVINEGRGVYVLLRSVQNAIMDSVVRIARDDVDRPEDNPSRKKFKQSQPCHALTLLRYCARLPRNRKKLLQARAPTILLALLLEVLKALETNRGVKVGGNATAEVLQELIESLTSDISTVAANASVEDGYESDLALDAASMPMLLEQIETISLSPPLRSIIAKLLPFLTYGQSDLSKQLAEHFNQQISMDGLEQLEDSEACPDTTLLMRTFVDTAATLPATDICSLLRVELISCGFVDRLMHFIMRDMPKEPPAWVLALWSQGMLPGSSAKAKADFKKRNEEGWRAYYNRKGLATTIKMLTGLSRKHEGTQYRIALYSGFVQSCHWIESTSDNSSAAVSTNGLGILCETLLDELSHAKSSKAGVLVSDTRNATKQHKKAMAQQRRNQALMRMKSLGALPGTNQAQNDQANSSQQYSVRGTAASILAPVLGLFRDSNNPVAQDAGSSSKAAAKSPEKKPAWLKEAESMVEETGLQCAICHEGRTLQPKQLLCMYTFAKKVSVPGNTTISRSAIDGTLLLKAISPAVTEEISLTLETEEWLSRSRSAIDAVALHTEPESSSDVRASLSFITSTSAGNAIHASCHRRARQADRNHPKAPKSEWEGACLRNNRVRCNALIPMISKESSSVSVMDVNAGLSNYQLTLADTIGFSQTTMLWPVLHDIRFLLLRMAYGESLSSDSGGGSLTSNCQLLFYQLKLAEVFDKEAQLDSQTHSLLARGLSAGSLLASTYLRGDQLKKVSVARNQLARGLADSAPMAALSSIIFHNMHACGGNSVADGSDDAEKPHPKREWLVGRELFLRALLICGGRRHVLGLNSSGCQATRTLSGRKRSASFTEWDAHDEHDDSNAEPVETSRTKGSRRKQTKRRDTPKGPTVDDFQNSFRPMITLFAVLDRLSAEFSPNMSDDDVVQSAQRTAQVIENCHGSQSIHDLIRQANVPLDSDQMMDLLQMGMVLG